MILDERSEFADAVAVTVTAVVGDVIDLGATPTLRGLGNGQPLYLVINCDTTATAAGAATATFTLESDSTDNLATSATVHASTGAVAVASLVAGTFQRVIPLPTDRSYERYLGVRATIATGPLTAGKFNAFLTSDPTGWSAYPDAAN